MQNTHIFINKALLKFIAALSAAVCSMLLIRGIYAVSDSSIKRAVTIIEYAGIGAANGQITIQELEQDILYLTNKGYTPIFASDVADCLRGEKDIADKAIVLSFDGNCSAYYSKLFPLLKKYRFKAVITVTGEQTEYASNSADDNAAYLNWTQIKEMDNSGLVEFSNGTYSMWDNGGFTQKDGESYEEYRSRIVTDIGRLQILFQENCGFEPTIFTYPGGLISDNSARLVKHLEFQAGIGSEGKYNLITGKTKADPYRLKRCERAKYGNIPDLLED